MIPLKLKLFQVNLMTDRNGLEREFNQWSADNPDVDIVKQTLNIQNGSYNANEDCTLLVMYRERKTTTPRDAKGDPLGTNQVGLGSAPAA